MTDCFEAYKLVLDNESGRVVKWVEVKNIGDNSLLLGDNYSISFQLLPFQATTPTPYIILILSHTTPMGRLALVFFN